MRGSGFCLGMLIWMTLVTAVGSGMNQTGAATLNVPGDFTTIQSAIDAARDGDTVFIESGVYEENVDLLGKSVRLIGQPADAPTIRPGRPGTVITAIGIETSAILRNLRIEDGTDPQGGGILCIGSTLVVDNCVLSNLNANFGGAIYAIDSTLTVRDCTFTNNNAVASRVDQGRGGAICAEFATVNAMNCTFLSNSAALMGGAIDINDGQLILEGCEFSGNMATLANGGGVAARDTDVTMRRTSFVANGASIPSGSGGGLWALGKSDVVVEGCTFVDNGSISGSFPPADGGGISAQVTNITVTDTFIQGNSSEDGGGIFAAAVGFATFENCQFVDNVSGSFSLGGALNVQAKRVRITHCEFDDNLADEGGAVGITGENVIVERSTFIRNRAFAGRAGALRTSGSVRNCMFLANRTGFDDGGAVVMDSGSIANCLLIGNRAGVQGSAVFALGDTQIDNCTITASGGGIFPQSAALSASPDASIAVRNSIIWNNDNNTFAGDVAFDHCIIEESVIGRNNVMADPRFHRIPHVGPDGMWGTGDDNYGDLHVRLQSPAVDMGNLKLLPNDLTDLDGDGDSVESIPFDLDEMPRVFGCNVDAGAYEAIDPAPLFADCNANGLDDRCEIANGTINDLNGSGVPDECEAMGDINGDGCTNSHDLKILLDAFNINAGGDLNLDGVTSQQDLGILLAFFTSKCD